MKKKAALAVHTKTDTAFFFDTCVLGIADNTVLNGAREFVTATKKQEK